MERNYEFYLLMLERLLLDIRNFDEEHLKYAPMLAYIFHNIPAELRCNLNEGKGDEAYKVLMARAEHFGLTEVIKAWERDVYRQLEREKDLTQNSPDEE